MKQRFSSLDVKIIAHELSNSLVSLRLANIYDLSSRIFLLKFAKPDRREQLLIDSGFRCHLTSFTRATAAAPSVFVAKLRKFLRTRRVTAVSQIGTDRVVEIQFSDGAYRLFLEFYAGGNVVLTDGELTILHLLRNVGEGAENEQYKLGLKYDLSLRQNYAGVPSLTKERIRTGLENAVRRQQEEAQKPGKKIKKKAGDVLRKALAVTTTEFPPVLIDHALEVASFDRETPPEQVIEDSTKLEKLVTALEEASRTIAEITGSEIAKGYILARTKKPRGGVEVLQADDAESSEAELTYDDFHPFKPAQLLKDESTVFIEYEGFNKAVDKFFSSIEGQKLESRLQERESTAQRKIEHARQEQAKRIDGLQQVQELNVRKAQAIEANVERVEEAAAAVNGLIAQGMDWVDIGKLIENEQSRGNPVAETIRLPLKLEENTITVLLSEFDEVIDEDMADETDSDVSDSDDEANAASASARPKPEEKRLVIDIDLALSPWSNARNYYENRRAAAVKQERTAQASQKALKSTEQKVMADLKKGLKQEKEVLRPTRRQMWFEKFIYFLSSDGYLVLAGRDAQQNEVLYRRYLKRGDIYVHADMHGAASVIIKNNPSTPEAPIPPSTLSQAGSLAVCTSSAWDSKAVMSAWWVNSDQVSKTAPTGEYLTTGGFMVRGKKNFLPPAQLLLGFAVVFQISEESKARHAKHRLRDTDTVGKAEESTVPQKVATEEDDEDDEDDDFPDADHGRDDDSEDDAAQRSSQSKLNENEDEDEDEFPDVHSKKSQDASEDDEGGSSQRANPLQVRRLQKAAAPSVNEESQNEDDDEEDDGEVSVADGEGVDASKDGVSNGTGDGNDGAGAGEPQAEQADSKTNGNANGQQTKPKTSVPQVRGKRGKAKKKANKYAEQDEEDRELAMKLLGSRAADERREAEAAEKAAKSETAEEARARRKAQHDKVQKQGLEAEEIRRLNLEEGVEDINEDEAAALTQLDALVGTPLPGDEILEAIPICAPWTALGKYKYKAKLQPGQQKKGKAVREILGKWAAGASTAKAVDQHSQDTERIWPRETELIKAWREPEILGIIPVKSVRVMMGGGSAGGGGDKGKGGRGGKSGRGGKGSKKAR